MDKITLYVSAMIWIFTQLIQELSPGCFVFLLETVQTALTGVDVYRWFITGFGNLDSLKDPNFAAIDSPTIDAIISLIVQGFYCFRIWTLRKQLWWLSVIIAIVRICLRIPML
jgi:hypothetical protein